MAHGCQALLPGTACCAPTKERRAIESHRCCFCGSGASRAAGLLFGAKADITVHVQMMKSTAGRIKHALALCVCGLLLAVAGIAPQARAQAAPDGAALFKEHCAACHQAAPAEGNRAPSPAILAQKTQQEILQTLESGPMVVYGNQLNEGQRRAIAAFLSSKVSADVSSVNLCARAPAFTPQGLANPQNWNGWGVDVLNMRYQTHTSIGPGNVGALKVKWAFGIPNASSALGQPTVVAGRVFIG